MLRDRALYMYRNSIAVARRPRGEKKRTCKLFELNKDNIDLHFTKSNIVAQENIL